MAKLGVTTASAAVTLLIVIELGSSLSIPGFVSQGVRARTKRTVDKEFICMLPINTTANEPYITCKIINETQREFGLPATTDERYRPRFEYALRCSNLTSQEAHEEESEEEEEESHENSSSESEESEEHEDGEESSEESCLEDPYDDCAVQCVYDKSNVLNKEGLPEAEPLYYHLLNLLDRDSTLKPIVKEAVWNCHKELMKTVHKYGLENLDQCLLLETVDECMEFEIGLKCPKRLRQPYKKPRE